MGRGHTFGPCVTSGQRESSKLHHFWKGTPQGVFYNDQSLGTSCRVIGVSYGSVATVTTEEPEYPRTLLPPPTPSYFYWYYSEASLDQVRAISISRQQGDDRPVGALITYANNTIAVLGQWQKPCTITARHVVSAGTMLYWKEVDNSTVDMRICDRGLHRDETHFADFAGTLVWYTSLLGTSVITRIKDIN